MILQYASDLHLEFEDNSRVINSDGFKAVGNILLLAGDIIYLENTQLEQNSFFDWCSENFRETFIVPGNHEYYGGFPLEATLAEYEYFIRKNVRYINNKSIQFGDTEVFATTLWTVVVPQLYGTIQYGMNDCRQIWYNGHHLIPQEYAEIHSTCKDWLDKSLHKSNAIHKIVLTHHCPSTGWAFQTPQVHRWLDSAFYVDMSKFINEHDIEYWIFGHTHTRKGSGTTFTSMNGHTTLLCNQLGYVEQGEDCDFTTDAIISI